MVEKQGMNRISKNPALLQNSNTVKHSYSKQNYNEFTLTAMRFSLSRDFITW